MAFDPKTKIEELVTNIRKWFDENGPKASAVIGISGGKDSTVSAALLVRALGPERVIGVMMPNGIQTDINDSKRVIEALGITGLTVNIDTSFAAMIESTETNNIAVNEDAKVNLQPRLRMCALYMIAQSLPNGGRVINTCNRSEDYVGYATKYGDCAGDLSILGNLLVKEILKIGDELTEIPNDLIHKAPSDGLWGVTDEDKLGFTYKQLDDYIAKGSSGDPEVNDKIYRMYKNSRHKYEEMPVCSHVNY